jgi:hypothetical protein
MTFEAPIQPPARWLCDTCGEQVTDPAGALVVWRVADRDGGGHAFRDFKIVHKGPCDPESQAGYVMSLEVDRFTGPDGLTMLLSWLSIGPLKGGGYPRVAPEDLDAYVDLVRRVQLPGYEEARRYFDDPGVREWHGESNEVWPYTVQALREIPGHAA